MISIPDKVKELLSKDGIRKNFRVHFSDGSMSDLTNVDIVSESVTFTESLCSQDKLKFGLCESSVIEFETVGVDNIKGKTIECGIDIDVSTAIVNTEVKSQSRVSEYLELEVTDFYKCQIVDNVEVTGTLELEGVTIPIMGGVDEIPEESDGEIGEVPEDSDGEIPSLGSSSSSTNTKINCTIRMWPIGYIGLDVSDTIQLENIYMQHQTCDISNCLKKLQNKLLSVGMHKYPSEKPLGILVKYNNMYITAVGAVAKIKSVSLDSWIEHRSDLSYPSYYIPYGVFVVDNCKRSADSNHRKVQAYSKDKLMNFELPESIKALETYSWKSSETIYLNSDDLLELVFPTYAYSSYKSSMETTVTRSGVRDFSGRAFSYGGTSYSVTYYYDVISSPLHKSGVFTYKGFDIPTESDLVDALKKVSTYISTHIGPKFEVGDEHLPLFDTVTFRLCNAPYMQLASDGLTYTGPKFASSLLNNLTSTISDGLAHSVITMAHDTTISSVEYKTGTWITFMPGQFEFPEAFNTSYDKGRYNSIRYIKRIKVQKGTTELYSVDIKPNSHVEYYAHKFMGESTDSVTLSLKSVATKVKVYKDKLGDDKGPTSVKTQRTDYTFAKALSDLVNKDFRSIVESMIELKGLSGRFNRYGEFELFKFEKSMLLYPSETLYPAEGLYPKVETNLLDTSMYRSLWYADEVLPPISSIVATYTNLDGDETSLSYNVPINIDEQTELLGTNTVNISWDGIASETILNGVADIGMSVGHTIPAGEDFTVSLPDTVYLYKLKIYSMSSSESYVINTVTISERTSSTTLNSGDSTITGIDVIMSDTKTTVYDGIRATVTWGDEQCGTATVSGLKYDRGDDNIVITSDVPVSKIQVFDTDSSGTAISSIELEFDEPTEHIVINNGELPEQYISGYTITFKSDTTPTSANINTYHMEYIPEYYEGSDGQSYDISDNYYVTYDKWSEEKLTAIVETVGSNIGGLQYMPVDLTCTGLPHLEAGDWINILTKSGSVSTIILRRTLKGVQSLVDTVESEGGME